MRKRKSDGKAKTERTKRYYQEGRNKAVKRILLIAPPFYRLMGSHYNGLNLGIAYIAAFLKKHGQEVIVYNADYRDDTRYANQKELFDNTAMYKSILDDKGHPIWQEIKDKIAAFAPELVGINMMTANFTAARNIAMIVKSIEANIKIVVGGAHPTLDPEGTLTVNEFDYVVRGEGEITLLELVEGREPQKILGLSFRRGKLLIHNKRRPFIKDLDILPFPERNSFLNDTSNLELGYVATGRGCPFACAYCASPQLWQRTLRLRSVPNVMAELGYLKANYGAKMIHFIDDTFTASMSRTTELCQQIIAQKLGIQWVCDTRIDRIDEELLSLMKQAGCARVKIGVESGSDQILKKINKAITTEKVRQAVRLIKKCGIPLTVYFMTGFPGETDEDLRKTIDFARELNADYYSLSVLAPYYGTEIWKMAEKSGKKLDKEHWEYFYHQSQEMILNNNISPELINEFFSLNEWGKGARV